MTPPGEPEVCIAPTEEAVSALAAEQIVDRLRAAIQGRGRADFVTTGGSTPVGIYRLLAGHLRGEVDWSVVHFWWSDDRFVPRDHPHSNFLPADAILFAAAAFAGQSGNVTGATDIGLGAEPGLVVPGANIHPFPCSEAIAEALGPDWCAAEYAAELGRSGLHVERGFPQFDLVLLGLGPDGHIMSVFPNSPAWDRTEWALAIPAPTHVAPQIARVTLNPGVLGVAGSVLLVTSGAAKADVVGRIFATERDIRRLPAQAVRRTGATWILDEAAAVHLPAGLGVRRCGRPGDAVAAAPLVGGDRPMRRALSNSRLARVGRLPSGRRLPSADD